MKPAISNVPKSVSATVAAHANDTVNELGNGDVTAPVYSTKSAKSPQDRFFAPEARFGVSGVNDDFGFQFGCGIAHLKQEAAPTQGISQFELRI